MEIFFLYLIGYIVVLACIIIAFRLWPKNPFVRVLNMISPDFAKKVGLALGIEGTTIDRSDWGDELSDIRKEFEKIAVLVSKKKLLNYEAELSKLAESLIAMKKKINSLRSVYKEFSAENLETELQAKIEALTKETNPLTRTLIGEQVNHYQGCLKKVAKYEEVLCLYETQKDTILCSLKHMRLRLTDNEITGTEEIAKLNSQANNIHTTMDIIDDI